MLGSLSDVMSGDIFQTVSLSQAIVKLPNKPSKLGDMGIFEQNPINTITAVIEEHQGVISVIQTAPRGTRTNEMKHAKRQTRAFVVPHIPAYDSVKADEVLGYREFGQDAATLQTVAKKITDRLQVMKDSIDLTKERMRIGCLQGVVKDADDTTLFNWFTEFGSISRNAFQFHFGATRAVEVKASCQLVTRQMIKNLGGTPFTGITAICGDDFWDAFITSTGVTDAYKNYATNTMMQQQQRNGFMFGDIYWINYTGYFGSTNAVPAAEAQFFPMGVPNLFQEILAPGDMISAVGTLGLPYYAQQEVLPYDLGVQMRSQSNPLFICSRPGTLIQGTFTTGS